ncbi:sensor histidine kinase, partial [Vibrio parahaemolyticus]|uniref:sensor histidine kinase n=1 Tax=Vibrio parahaemolyticus TaxID=670 RepID=UPI002115A846
LSAPQQRVELDVPAVLRLDGWPDVLERALDNLLRNALRFNPPALPIVISATAAAGEVRIQVRDHGPGVKVDDLPRLGEPF